MESDHAHQYTCVSQLSTTCNRTMRLRVLHLWDGTYPTKPGQIFHYNALLIDEMGHTIQAQSYPGAAIRSCPLLRLGEIITLTDFFIIDNFRSYRYAPAKNYIVLTDSTIINKYNGPVVAIPKSYYNFIDFEYLKLRSQTNNRELTDVIGLVTALTLQNTNTPSGKTAPSKVLTLRDVSGSETKVVLWPPFDETFNHELLKERSEIVPIIAAFTGMAIKFFNDELQLWTTPGSVTAVNEQIAVFDEYKNRFEGVDLDVTDYRVAIPMTLTELVDGYASLKKGQEYRCKVKVLGIDESSPWCYEGCELCTKKVAYHDHNSYWWCPVCGVVDSSLSRYRVNLNVTDGVSGAFFLLFDRTAQTLFEQPAHEVIETHGIDYVPPFMKEAIVGKEKIFYVVLNHDGFPRDKRGFIVNRIEPSFQTPTITPRTPHQEHDSFPTKSPKRSAKRTLTFEDDDVELAKRRLG